MKLCFAIGTLSYSGAEKIMLNLVNELHRRGHEVDIILISCDNKEIELSGIRQYPISNDNEKYVFRFFRMKERVRRIREVIKKHSYDAVISFGVVYNVDVVLACIGLGTKLVLCERNDPQNDPRSLLLRLRRKLTYSMAHGFVFQTEVIKSFFSKKIQRKSIVIPNFVTSSVIESHNYAAARRDSFVTCARLDDNQKNQSGLIKAFAQVNKEYPYMKLELYGEGPDREKYEALINEMSLEKCVILHGRKSNAIEEAKKCKFFILSSKYEGMPNALIEAMSVGMVCIATDCGGGGARSLVKDYVDGILVPFGDENALVDAMKYVIENKNEAEKMARNAMYVNSALDMKKVISIWERYLESVCR